MWSEVKWIEVIPFWSYILPATYISTIYSKQGREVQLSSRKLAIGRKIWICHVEELEKLFPPKLLNFRSRFFLLLNLAFSKKSRKRVVFGGWVETILIAWLHYDSGSVVQLVRDITVNLRSTVRLPATVHFFNLVFLEKSRWSPPPPNSKSETPPPNSKKLRPPPN